jgi:hypothetical protein
MTAALQLFSKFNCKELLLNKYVNAKYISEWTLLGQLDPDNT